MKKFAKTLVFACALAASLSVGAGNTAQAKTKVTVKSVKAVDKLTGKTSITLTKGKTATLKTTVKVTPNKDANKKVTYKSKNPAIATVSSTGKITAVKKGSTTITVTSKKKNAKNKKVTAKVKVKVVTGKVTSLKLNKTSATLTEGDTLKLKATVKASSGANKKLAWSSSKKSVATVKDGMVTAVKAGDATITVKTTDGTNKKKTCKIKVNAKPQEASTTTEQKQDEPTIVEKKTTVAPVTGKAVEVEVALKDASKVQSDLNSAAKTAGVKTTDTFKVNLDGTDYTATYDGTNVKVAGKLVSEVVAAKNAKTVKVKVNVKTDKIAAAIAFAPASVSSLKVAGVTFTDITTTTVKIDGVQYSYTVSGSNIVITGDASAALAKLVNAKVVTATVK